MRTVFAILSAVAFTLSVSTKPTQAFQSEGTLRIGAMWAITGGVSLTGKGALNLSRLAIEDQRLGWCENRRQTN